MPIPTINIPAENTLDDIFMCDSCKQRQSNYFSPAACKTCDGTNHYEPVGEKKNDLSNVPGPN